MDLKEMSIEALEERKAAIAAEVDAPEADLDALEAEARSIKEEIERRKADEEKRSLIEKIASKMEDFHHMDEEIPASGVDLVEIVNPEREISFIIGENHYSLTLTRHRNNKK